MSSVVVLSPEQIEEVVRRAVRAELQQATPEVLSTEQAARLVGVERDTICGWIKQGLPTAGRAGRQHRIRRADLEAWMARPRGQRGEQGADVDLEVLAGKLARRASRG